MQEGKGLTHALEWLFCVWVLVLQLVELSSASEVKCLPEVVVYLALCTLTITALSQQGQIENLRHSKPTTTGFRPLLFFSLSQTLFTRLSFLIFSHN